MSVGAPQIVWFVLVALHLLISAANDGEPKKGNHSLSVTMLSACVSFGLLWWGGFFA